MAKVNMKPSDFKKDGKKQMKITLLKWPLHLLLQITELLYKDPRFNSADRETSGKLFNTR